MDQPSPLTLLLLAVIAALAVAVLVLSTRGGRRARSRAQRALAGEAEAAALLSRAGYAVVDSQTRSEVVVVVDGEEERYEVRADYLVEARGQSWIAEVKTGERAPRLSHGATRRQLMEYALAFDVDGVLLVTPEDGRIRAVRFPERAREGGPSSAGLFAAGLLCGMLIAAAALVLT